MTRYADDFVINYSNKHIREFLIPRKRVSPHKGRRGRKKRSNEHKKAIQRAWKKAYYQKNKEKLINNALMWQKQNPEKASFTSMKRYTKRLQRTPKWLSQGDWIKIKWAYTLASQMTKSSGIKYEVDHIIPLQGENVSGLHVPWNLKILTKTENCSKGNR